MGCAVLFCGLDGPLCMKCIKLAAAPSSTEHEIIEVSPMLLLLESLLITITEAATVWKVLCGISVHEKCALWRLYGQWVAILQWSDVCPNWLSKHQLHLQGTVSIIYTCPHTTKSCKQTEHRTTSFHAPLNINQWHLSIGSINHLR